MERRALIVLGGGLFADGTQPPWVQARVGHAARLWTSARFERVITSGQGPVPQRCSEARALAEALVQRGVPREVIVLEEASTTTVANAYHSKAVHTDPLGLDDVVVVTNAFHAARAEKIFAYLYGHEHVQLDPSDDAGLDREIVSLFAVLERTQDRFMQEILAKQTPTGATATVHDFLFRPDNAWASLWQERKERDEDYRTARGQLSALMHGRAGFGH